VCSWCRMYAAFYKTATTHWTLLKRKSFKTRQGIVQVKTSVETGEGLSSGLFFQPASRQQAEQAPEQPDDTDENHVNEQRDAERYQE